MSKALVLDGQWRKSLSFVRSLGKSGVDVTVGENTRFATSFFSKYAKSHFVYSDLKKNPEKFLTNIIQYIKDEGFDVVYPLEDDSVSLFADEMAAFSKICKVAIPDKHVLDLGLDKAKTLKIAKKIGVEIPKTQFLDKPTEVEKIINDVSYPLIIKPRRSQGSKGVKKVTSADDLIYEYLKLSMRYKKPLIQDFVRGQGYGCSMLYDQDGVEKAFFMHKRIREYPISGGPSTLRESVYDEDLLESTRRLFEKMQWRGVAMAEYKKDEDTGEFKLMEVNPRIWGSLELAVYSGVDFPSMLHKIMMGEKVDQITKYDVGKQCRWLYPGDIMNFISNLRHFKIKWDFFRFSDPNMKYDIIHKDDIMPVIGRTLALTTSLFKPKMWKLLMRR